MVTTQGIRLRFFQSLLALFLIVGSASFVFPAAAQDEAPVQDLAAMSLNPLDLTSANIEGFAIRNGKYADAQTLSGILAAKVSLDSAALTETLASNGYADGYTLELADPEVMGDPSQGLNGVVSSSIVEFGDETQATAVFEAIATTATFPGSTDLSTEGVDAFLAGVNVTVTEGSEPIAGVVALRQDANRIGIVIAAPATTAETMQPLIDRLIEKIQIITTDGGPDLGRRALLLTGSAVETQFGEYALGYGAPMRLVTQSDSVFEAISQRFEPATDGYQQIQIVTGGDGSRYGVQTIILDFETEDEASAWIKGAFDRQAAFRGQSELQADEEFPAIGDESSALTYVIENGNGVRQSAIRVGDKTAVIDVIALQMVDRQMLEEVSSIQADCLANTCEPQEPPAAFGVGILATPVPAEASPTAEATVTEASPTAEATEPEATPTEEPVVPPATPTEEPVAPATPPTLEATEPDATPVMPAATPVVEGEQPISEDLYGIQIPFSQDWDLVSQTVDGTRSSIDLTNGVSTVSVVGDSAYAGNPKSCFDDALVYLETVEGATQITEVRDANDNPTYVETEKSVQGIYSYLNAEGQAEAALVYCTIITPGEVTMLTIGTAAAADFPAQLPIIADLIETVQAPRT
jgi:antitoxin (DNA-binding transcriptional repressor) of toxin-antitoxin stability system